MSSSLSKEFEQGQSGQSTGELWGLMAEFPNAASLYHAAEHFRDNGYTKWDTYSPCPVHGMPEAMGLKPSKVSFVMGTMAFIGFSCAVAMQWWMSAVDYPIITAGKPFGAWEQFTPIMFELSVLFGAFGAIGGMLALNGLPMWYHPLLKKNRFLRVSDDRFVLAVEATDPKFNKDQIAATLTKLGGEHIDEVEA
jgi:hypothetical protein